MKRLIAIDGSSLLSTSFFGTLPPTYYKTKDPSGIMKTSSGVYTNGVYTMTKTILGLIEKFSATHIIVAWDISRNTFRRTTLYSDYKGTRKDTAPELKSQFGVMQDVLNAMGIKQFALDGFEADDILGSVSRRFEDEIPVTILTKDQDALQLITEKTRVWLQTSESKKYIEMLKIKEAEDRLKKFGSNQKLYYVPNGFFEFTPITFEMVYGLDPIQMIDKKSIEGDKSDNIPGVRNVGEASVVPLLQEFKTLEGIYEYLESVDEAEASKFFKELGIKRSPYKNLMAEKDMAVLSKKLATIKCDLDEVSDLSVAVNEESEPNARLRKLSELTIEDIEVKLKSEEMNKKFEELEFKSLAEKSA